MERLRSTIRHCRTTVGQNTQLLLEVTDFEFTSGRCLVSDENSAFYIPVRQNIPYDSDANVCLSYDRVLQSCSGLFQRRTVSAVSVCGQMLSMRILSVFYFLVCIRLCRHELSSLPCAPSTFPAFPLCSLSLSAEQIPCQISGIAAVYLGAVLICRP